MRRNLKLDGKEIVCPHIYNELGKGSLTYVDEKLREVLIWLKEGWFKDFEIVCNTYEEYDDKSSQIRQHGMICNQCSRELKHTFNLELYVTDQVLGKGVILKFVDLANNKTKLASSIIKEFQSFSTVDNSPTRKIPHPVYIRELDKGNIFLSIRLRKDKDGKGIIID